MGGQKKVLPAVLGGRDVQILLKLPVEAGEAPVSHLPGNQVQRIPAQVNLMACLLDAVVLNVFQGTHSDNLLEQSSKMTLTDAAVRRQIADGNSLRIMLIDIAERGADILVGGASLPGAVGGISRNRNMIHLRDERYQQTVDSSLVQSFLFMEFPKNPGNIQMEQRILTGAHHYRHLLRNVENLPEQAAGVSLPAQK